MQADRIVNLDIMNVPFEEKRAFAETAVTAGLAGIAATLLPSLEKTVHLSSAILSILQNFYGYRRYAKFENQDVRTNWPKFIFIHFASGIYIMSTKMAFDLILHKKTNYSPTIILTTSAINTISTSLFRYMTRN